MPLDSCRSAPLERLQRFPGHHKVPAPCLRRGMILVNAYDDVYSEDTFYWGTEPNSLCQSVVDLCEQSGVENRRVIDLGCGEGKDAIHFAKHGLAATGVDISRPGLDQANRWAAREGVSVQTFRSKAISRKPAGKASVQSHGERGFIMAIVAVSVAPLGTGSTSVSGYVAETQKVFARHPDLKTRLDPMFTTIEGKLSEIFVAIEEMHEALMDMGAQRLSTVVKIDDRRDVFHSMDDKVAAVDAKLHRETGTVGQQ